MAEARQLPTILWLSGSIADVTLPRTLDTLKEGSIATVDLTHSGLASGPGAKKLYIRKACCDLWEHLSKRVNKVSHIMGCPGVGTSVEVYMYSMWQAKFQKERVLYVRGSRVDGFSLVFKDDPNTDDVRTGRVLNFTDDTGFLFSFIRSLLQEDRIDLLVLDGQLGDLIRRTFFLLKDFPRVRMLTCTSFQALGKVSDEDFDLLPVSDTFVMDSWSREEYAAALKAGALKLHPTVSSLDEIFYYAGGSVRHIQRSVNEVINVVNNKMLRVPDVGLLVGSSAVGDASQGAVNSLMAIYGGRSIVVSEYATMKMLDKVSDDTIAKMRKIFPANPSWQGWITELEVLTLLRGTDQIRFRNDAGEIEKWPCKNVDASSVIVYVDESDTCLKPTKSTIGYWFQPFKWDQGCFDAVYKVSEHAVRVIQITNGESHSCKLKYLISLLQAMDVHVVDFVFVCRSRNFNKFLVPNPPLRILSSHSVEAKVEFHQYNDLLNAIKEIRAAKKKKEKKVALPAAKITFRKVCYQKDDTDKPLD